MTIHSYVFDKTKRIRYQRQGKKITLGNMKRWGPVP